MKTISEKFYSSHGNQSKMYVVVVKLDSDEKLKVSIRKNAYNFQSHCTLSRWDGDKWQHMVATPYADMLCNQESVPYWSQPQNIELYQQDAQNLIEEAKEILA